VPLSSKEQNARREKAPREKLEPSLLKKVRELRDRWMEHVRANGLPSGGLLEGKYHVGRTLALPATTATAAERKALPGGGASGHGRVARRVPTALFRVAGGAGNGRAGWGVSDLQSRGNLRTGVSLMNAMIETLETRKLMSATTELVAEAADTQTTALLLPAVQAAREAARSSTSGDSGGGPTVKLFSGSTNNAAGSSHPGGVNVLLMDGSVR
jgi:prepilin-type processing-associated H-X9-DG protein